MVGSRFWALRSELQFKIESVFRKVKSGLIGHHVGTLITNLKKIKKFYDLFLIKQFYF